MQEKNFDSSLTTKWENYSKVYLWWKAFRPQTLTATFVPVLLGNFLAISEKHILDWKIALFCLFSSFCIQIAANLFNDACDFQRGADNPHRIGFPRVTALGIFSFAEVISAGVLFIILALLFSIPLLLKGGVFIPLILFLSISASYFYSGGPYPLTYYGWGEIAIFIFCGLVNVNVAYFLQKEHFSFFSFLVGIQIGSLVTALVMMNNLRDVFQDKLVNKNTLAVRFGVSKSKKLIQFLLLMPFFLNFFWIFFGKSLPALFSFFSLPLALMVSLSVEKTEPSPLFNRIFSQTALLHFCFGILIALGLFFS